MKKCISALLLCFIVFQFSCKNKPTADQGEIKFETITVEESSGDCSHPDSSCYQIKISYPHIVLNNPGVQTRINGFILDTLLSTIAGFTGMEGNTPDNFEKILNLIFEDFQELKKEFSGYNQQWYVNIDSEIGLVTKDLISIEFLIDSYTGGAHGNSWVAFLNFETRTGAQIDWKYLINIETEFANKSEIAFRKVRDISPGASLDDEGFYFSNNRFVLPESIGFTNEGILSAFNPYEAGPYFLGPTRYVLSWTDLADLIKDPFSYLAE